VNVADVLEASFRCAVVYCQIRFSVGNLDSAHMLSCCFGALAGQILGGSEGHAGTEVEMTQEEVSCAVTSDLVTPCNCPHSRRLFSLSAMILQQQCQCW
jgi:hypothetical protein